jgi:hypothetical protein
MTRAVSSLKPSSEHDLFGADGNGGRLAGRVGNVKRQDENPS